MSFDRTVITPPLPQPNLTFVPISSPFDSPATTRQALPINPSTSNNNSLSENRQTATEPNDQNIVGISSLPRKCLRTIFSYLNPDELRELLFTSKEIHREVKIYTRLHLSSLEMVDIRILVMTRKVVFPSRFLFAPPYLKDVLNSCHLARSLDFHGMNEPYYPDDESSYEEKKFISINLSESSLSSFSMQLLIRSAPHLKELNLTDCINVDEPFFTKLINSCPELETLNVSGCDLSHSILYQISSSFKNLRSFSFNYPENRKETSEKGCLEGFIENSNKLHSLSMSFSNTIPKKFEASFYAHQKNLQEINLNGPIDDISIYSIIISCKKLRKLTLKNANFSDNGLRILADNTPFLTHFSLATLPPDLTVAAFIFFARHQSSLEELVLPKGFLLNHLNYNRIFSHLKRLHSLALPLSVTDETLIGIASSATSLEKIKFTANRVSKNALLHFMILLPRLHTLSLYLCDNLNDDVMETIAPYYSNLKYLVIEPAPVTDRFFIAIANNCPRLEHLEVFHRDKKKGHLNIGYYSLLALVENCKDLTTLQLASSTLQDDDLLTLKKLKKLKTLSLNNSNSITPDGIWNLASSSPSLKTVYFNGCFAKEIEKRLKQKLFLNLGINS